MKRILSISLCLILLISSLCFVSCGQKSEPLSFGLGVYTNVSKATSAQEDANGQGKVTIAAAALAVDADGKIVSCVLDTAEATVAYTADGKAIANDSLATKKEQGDGYNMKLYGGAAKEWYEQAAIFQTLVCGKTLNEVKALVAEGNKGNDEVITAGCTIMIHEFVYAIEQAYNNAAPSDVTADHVLELGISTEQTCADADGDKNGQNKLETTLLAVALDDQGKIVAASSDCVQVAFTFDAAGVSLYDTTKPVVSKKQAGDSYNMKLYGGAAKEWYEQAAIFDATCVGKTVSEVTALVGEDNYGTAELQSAGCTILVNGFVKAASKLAK